jgi:acetyltransferase-like isoleucine patch superfamily enzyme
MKKIIRNIGRIFSIIFPAEIGNTLARINRMLYTGYKSRKMKSFGDNSILCVSVKLIGEPYISIGTNSHIGKRTVISAWDKHEESNFTPEITVGNNVTIGEDCHITAVNKIIIGDDVLLGKKITVTDNAHGFSDYATMQMPPLQRPTVSKGAVVIKNKVWIGDKAVILPDVTIGEGAIIGANAVVTKDVPDYCVAAGNPAVVLKNVNGGGG